MHRSAAEASSRWIAYFQANAAAVHPLEWDRGANLSAADRFVIASSIAIFARGEAGSGRTIGRFARCYAARTSDWKFPTALRALFDEETRHASDLTRFMDIANIPRIQAEFSDGAFRFLRHRVGLDGALCLLVTAESIACIYYRALYGATASPLLRQLCVQILRDEVQHVRFQSQRIALLRERLSPIASGLRRALHAGVFAGAVAVVAVRHRRVLTAGLGPRRFLRLCLLQWRIIGRMIAGVTSAHPTRHVGCG